MNIDNRIVDRSNNDGKFRYWTFGEVIDILRRNDPDELTEEGFIKNFRDGQPIDGVNIKTSEYTIMRYLIREEAPKLGLKDYYESMTSMVTLGKYTNRLYNLVYSSMSREIHILDSLPKSTYNDLYEIFISKLPQDGSINIFSKLRELDIDFLISLRTDLTRYDIDTLCTLSEYKDKFPLQVLIRYLNLIHDQVRSGYDVDIVLRSIMEVESEDDD